MSRFCIINIAKLDEPAISDPRKIPLNCEVLPPENAPRCFYPEGGQDQAERELLRLAERYPEGEFVLFGAVARVAHYHDGVFNVERY